MMRRIVVSVASVALLLSGVVATQAGAAPKRVSLSRPAVRVSGGSATFSATVRYAKTCAWSSRPMIPGFTKTVGCRTGRVARLANFSANKSTKAKLYTVTLIVRGSGVAIKHWKITQDGATPPATTTTTTIPVNALGATEIVHDSSKNALMVTPSPIIDPATGADPYNQPNAGYRFVAVDMTLANQSSGTISDDANLDVQLIGTDNQAYSADFNSVSECTNFSYGEFTLLPGGTESGCVVFQLPSGVNAKTVQFSLGYGYLDVAQWTVAP